LSFLFNGLGLAGALLTFLPFLLTSPAVLVTRPDLSSKGDRKKERKKGRKERKKEKTTTSHAAAGHSACRTADRNILLTHVRKKWVGVYL